MPTLPWTPATAADGDADADGGSGPSAGAEVMASRFTLTSRRHTFRMLRAATAVRRALLASPGAVGVSLVARPLRNEYLTLSSWRDRAALDAFVRDPVHQEAMRSLRPAMATSAFTFWHTPAGGGTPTWEQAHRALAEHSDRDR
ncbi:Antibiotic biosynthesis monooxygenase [Frankia canadensis]|uniref:Antibiotic biosynthesis monooxygenase n=1 Tax=Frankia canadensis TaxID=1836972 RepID=A0A2I2KLU2_9ACTN|nr:antibiotic biosynthesis monooxygenase [Frankia canadensis]SNQ46634.1 Antibiotic biosynthesis monooxygenase [Frankia canadensis]SOU53924.1 Antibiotic biosynthesis monooxygenase [Frankia canadensis]